MTISLRDIVAQTVSHVFRCALFLESDIHAGGEGRLQARITHRDVEWVGVVVDVQKLGDGWLLGLSTQCHLQIGLLSEAIAHIERRRIVDNRANSVNWTSQILLNVVRTLRLCRHTHIHVEFVAHQSQLHIDVVSILLTFRVPAQTSGEIFFIRIAQETKQTVPIAVVLQHSIEGFFTQIGEVVSRRVILLIAIAEIVVHLQEDALRTRIALVAPTSTSSATSTTACHITSSITSTIARSRDAVCAQGIHRHRLRLEDVKRFGIGDAHIIVEAVVGRSGVSVGLIGRVIARTRLRLVKMHLREIGVSVAVIPIADASVDRHVASTIAETAMQLQLRAEVFALTIAHRLVLPAIHNQSQPIHQVPTLIAQRLLRMLKGIGIEGS